MMESDPVPRWGYPGGGSSPNTWRSPNPNYRGRGGGGYRGNGGGGQYSPRTNWRGQGQWTPSPHRGRGRGGYRPDYRTSSPYPRRGSPGGYDYRPQTFRPRNPNSSPRPRFQSTPYNPNDIECWVSPQMWEDPWAHLIHPSLLSESNSKFSVPTDCTDIGKETEALSFLKSTKDAVQKSMNDILAPESPSGFLDPESPSDDFLDPELPSVMGTSAFEYQTALDESGLGQDSDIHIPSSKETTTEITKIQVQEPHPVPVNDNGVSFVEPESTTEEAPPALLP